MTCSSDELMHSLALALSGIKMKYKFTISPHPVKPLTFRVVFSRPTFQSPETPVFVSLDIHAESIDGDTVSFVGNAENLQWPITLNVVGTTIETFPEKYIDKIWLQKMKVKSTAFWE